MKNEKKFQFQSPLMNLLFRFGRAFSIIYGEAFNRISCYSLWYSFSGSAACFCLRGNAEMHTSFYKEFPSQFCLTNKADGKLLKRS